MAVSSVTCPSLLPLPLFLSFTPTPPPPLTSAQAGQVSFFNQKLVKKYVVVEKDKEVLRRLAATKDERYPDLANERKRRDEEEKARLKANARAASKAEQELNEQRRKEKEERSYDRLFKSAAGGGVGDEDVKPSCGVEATEDASAANAFEEDFM